MNRASMGRVIRGVPSKQSVHEVFTNTLPSDHDSGWRESYIPRREVER
jgi:hypothetical protein